MAAEAVGEAALLEDLQERLHHVGVGLLDLVEEDDAVRAAADALGELAAFVVADVAGGRSDEAGDVELLHVLRHVDLDQRLVVGEVLRGDRLGEQRLAHAGGPEEEEGADRAARVLEVGSGAAERAGDGGDGVALADDGLGEFLLEVEEALHLVDVHVLERDAGGGGERGGDVVFGDVDEGAGALLLPLRGLAFEGFGEALRLVAQDGGLLEDLAVDGLVLAAGDLLDLLLELAQRLRAGRGVDAGLRAGLVDQVDRLVREEAAGDVARAQAGGGLDGGRVVLDVVERLVPRRDAAEDLDRLVHGRLVDAHGLESALERGVLLDELAVFVERGRADALEFAAGERRLEDVGGVHRALGTAGADDAVDLVDEEDDVAGFADLLDDGLDALLELAAVLRAGDEQREIERDDAARAELLGDVARVDGLSEAFDDGGLADAGLAEQRGVVLVAAAEDLDEAAHFVGAADHRVELPLGGHLGEVAAEGVEGGGLAALAPLQARGPGPGRALEGVAAAEGRFAAGVAAERGRVVLVLVVVRVVRVRAGLVGGVHRRRGGLDGGIDRGEALVERGAERVEHFGGDPLALPEDGEEDVFGVDEGRVEVARLGGGELEHLLAARGEGQHAHGLGGAFAVGDEFFDFEAHGLDVEAEGLVHGGDDAVVEADDAEEKVLRADGVVVEPMGLAVGDLDHLFGVGGEKVESVHGGFRKKGVGRGGGRTPSIVPTKRACGKRES